MTDGEKTVYELVRAAGEDSAIIKARERNPGMRLLWAKPETTTVLHPNPQVWCLDSGILRRKHASSTLEGKCSQSHAHLLKNHPQAGANADQS